MWHIVWWMEHVTTKVIAFIILVYIRAWKIQIIFFQMTNYRCKEILTKISTTAPFLVIPKDIRNFRWIYMHGLNWEIRLSDEHDTYQFRFDCHMVDGCLTDNHATSIIFNSQTYSLISTLQILSCLSFRRCKIKR